MLKWKEYLMRTDTLPDTRVHLLTYTSDKYSDEKVLRRNVFSVYDIHSRVGWGHLTRAGSWGSDRMFIVTNNELITIYYASLDPNFTSAKN